MRILVGKTFGIGNACMAVPMIKALATLGDVDVLVGTGRDDFGALTIMEELKRIRVIGEVFTDAANPDILYDVAIMAIPFDGRWMNGVHYRATTIMDGRRRPDNIERLGFDMWKKHEAEYQMENARELGFIGEMPDPSFMVTCPDECCRDLQKIHIGVGYKRDPGGFGLSKHWGNENFVSFCKEILSINPDIGFIITGGTADWIQSAIPIMRAVGHCVDVRNGPLELSFLHVSRCGSYFGNDTGMMHVAASMGLKTYGLTPYPDLRTKNPPLCQDGRMELFGEEPEVVARKFADFVWGEE